MVEKPTLVKSYNVSSLTQGQVLKDDLLAVQGVQAAYRDRLSGTPMSHQVLQVEDQQRKASLSKSVSNKTDLELDSNPLTPMTAISVNRKRDSKFTSMVNSKPISENDDPLFSQRNYDK
jgi:hypothetical protein